MALRARSAGDAAVGHRASGYGGAGSRDLCQRRPGHLLQHVCRRAIGHQPRGEPAADRARASTCNATASQHRARFRRRRCRGTAAAERSPDRTALRSDAGDNPSRDRRRRRRGRPATGQHDPSPERLRPRAEWQPTPASPRPSSGPDRRYCAGHSASQSRSGPCPDHPRRCPLPPAAQSRPPAPPLQRE